MGDVRSLDYVDGYAAGLADGKAHPDTYNNAYDDGFNTAQRLLQRLLRYWESSLPGNLPIEKHGDNFTDAHATLVTCAGDIRHFIETSELPPYVPEDYRHG